MRFAALALISAGMLAACGQNGAGTAFPDLSSGHYRAEATVTSEDGSPMPVVMIRDGARMRIEFSDPEGRGDMAIVSGGAEGENFVLITSEGRTMAMNGLPTGQGVQNPADQWNADLASTATRTGNCSVAGENGSEWTKTGEDGVVNTACVTDDGIILRSAEGDRTVWETTSVSRGAQDAALFTLPPGVQTVDLGAMMGAAAAAAGAQGGGDAQAQLCQMLRGSGAPAEAISRAGC